MPTSSLVDADVATESPKLSNESRLLTQNLDFDAYGSCGLYPLSMPPCYGERKRMHLDRLALERLLVSVLPDTGLS
jgi:hypothetical protein